jgi:hypothetical protein
MQIILTSASILHIKPEDLPVHKINVVGTALVSDSIVFTNLGIQFECIISDYIAKDKPTEIPIVLFHPNGSRLKSQTTMLKRGSSIFFSGSLSSIEGKLYLELHNLSFIRTQQQSSTVSRTKEMPWASQSSSQSSSSSNLHKKIQEQQQQSLKKNEITKKFQPNKLVKITSDVIDETFDKDQEQEDSVELVESDVEEILDEEEPGRGKERGRRSITKGRSTSQSSSLYKKIQEQQQSLGKHEITRKFQPNKLTKLSEIASSKLAETFEEDQEQEDSVKLVESDVEEIINVEESGRDKVKGKRGRGKGRGRGRGGRGKKG